MNIDRSLFLALATSLAAAACAGSTGDAAGDDTEAAGAGITASASGSTSCWAPQTESVRGVSQEWYAEQLGFDPVADYPSAEGFCIDMVWANGIAAVGSVDYTSQSQLMDKCYAYAKSYVPFTTYETFYKMKQIKDAGPTETYALWGKLYELDHAIAADQVVCITSAAKKLCSGHSDTGCKIVASQLKTGTAPNTVRDCIKENKFDAFTCTESAGSSF